MILHRRSIGQIELCEQLLGRDRSRDLDDIEFSELQNRASALFEDVKRKPISELNHDY